VRPADTERRRRRSAAWTSARVLAKLEVVELSSPGVANCGGSGMSPRLGTVRLRTRSIDPEPCPV